MNAYDFVHLALYATGGEIHGKTKLQKTIYFLVQMTDCSDDLGYRPHYYGPYSSSVAAATDRLRSLGFVDQKTAGYGAVDSHGFEVTRCDFSLNEKGKHVAELKAARYGDLLEKLKTACKKLREAGDLDYMELSIAAKTYFMLDRKHDESTTEELSGLADRFGWSVTRKQITDAGDFLKKVNLVRLKVSRK